ncbi:phosphoribosylglycinamide formyltransferase [Thiomonas sp. X19]|uniref:phosphoribosylglycinamide formyltransferase n=1 Tax=Thiomonas sp. X19 TaxID=1050370 RepID=UPI000DD842EA|nr:phosphoribosylglycinamide formyltransferase [Thiomonas sp. X19]
MQAVQAPIVILISGRGTNMQAIVRACTAEAWPARVAAVISNRPDAAGLGFARELGIATHVVDHCQASNREAFDAALAACIDAYAPKAVALAGFMRVLTPGFVRRYAGRLINIHPSLLPAFAGLGTHRRALDAGVKWHGATVHLVTPDVDHGPIVAQAVVPVLDGDTEESLAARVLDQEHRIYPAAVRALVEGRLQVQGLHVRVLPAPCAQPRQEAV